MYLWMYVLCDYFQASRNEDVFPKSKQRKVLIIRPEARTAQGDGADRSPPLPYSFLELWLLSYRTELNA